MSSTKEDAQILLASIRASFKNGMKHFDAEGNLLGTEVQVLNALVDGGVVEVDISNRVEVTTAEEELEKIVKGVH